MTAITRPFDEDSYPPLPEALLEVLALARELANTGQRLRTTTVAERLSITRNAAYKRIRRLRELGLLRSQLIWITDESGSYPIRARRRDGGKGAELRSWLESWPAGRERWGEPDATQDRFDPRTRKHLPPKHPERKGDP